jgi:hypothetical protein
MAARFWVGGTGNWSDATNHWATGSGGSPAAVNTPASADTCTFDGLSGGGTCTLDVDITINTLTLSAFTGTFSAATHNVTLSAAFTDAATGVHTLNMGSALWILSATGANSTPWNVTAGANLTLNGQTSTILLTGVAPAANRTFAGGAHTYNNLTIQNGVVQINGSNTFNQLTLGAPAYCVLQNATTQNIATLTDTGTGSGASSQNMLFNSTLGSTGSTTVINLTNASTIHWTGIRGIFVTGATPLTAQNSFDLGGNTGITITAPSGGGGGAVRSRVFTGM